MKEVGMGPRVIHRGLLTLVCLLTVPAAMAAEPAAATECCKNTGSQYRADREAVIADGKKQLQKIADEAAKQNFSEALNLCLALEKQLAGQPGSCPEELLSEVREAENQVRRGWSAELMKKAHARYIDKDYTQAIQLAGEAQQILPAPSAAINDFIEGCQAHRDGADFRDATRQDPQIEAVRKSRQEATNLLREAKVFFANKRYESAATSLERLLIVDPFNSEAIELLNLCYTKLFQIGTRRYNANREGISAANIWEWTEPIRGFGESKTNTPATIKGHDNNELYNQLERIIFPSIDFEGTDLATVIRYLGRQSRIVDPEQQGVDVILNSPEYAKRQIDVKLSNISMLDLLRLICQQAGVAYSLQNNIVVIGARGKMHSKAFKLSQEVVNKLCPNASMAGGASSEAPTLDAYTARGDGGNAGGMSAGAGGMGSGLTPSGSASLTMGDASRGLSAITASTSTEEAAAAVAQATRDAALTNFFISLKVPFPGDASLQYNYNTGDLLVLNTMENLQLIDKIVQQLNNRDTYLVLIEAKLLELNNTTLDELGFDWQFNAASTGGNWAMATGDSVIRSGTTSGTDTTYYRIINGLKIFPNFGEKIFGSDMNVNLSLSINAVSQNSNTETLSSPRILSNDGAPAMIEMVEETYFVEEWEAPDTENDINTTLIGPEPDWGEMHPLGITFSVTPHISPNKQSIKLENLDVKFSVHTDDTHYPWQMVTWYYDAGGTKHTTYGQGYDLKMPIIAGRRMKATLTVDDGATVMLGGLVNNKDQGRDDKWPFLGDIPFLGNFFRDQQNQVTNNTMVVFVTARIIHPNGEPKRSIQNQGLIDFKR